MLIRRLALMGLALMTWIGVAIAAAFMAYAADRAGMSAPCAALPDAARAIAGPAWSSQALPRLGQTWA